MRKLPLGKFFKEGKKKEEKGKKKKRKGKKKKKKGKKKRENGMEREDIGNGKKYAKKLLKKGIYSHFLPHSDHFHVVYAVLSGDRGRLTR